MLYVKCKILKIFLKISIFANFFFLYTINSISNMNKKYTRISNPVQWCNFQQIKAKNTTTLLSNINLFTERLFSCLNVSCIHKIIKMASKALFQNLLAIGDKIKVHFFTILGGIGHTTYFHVDEKVLSLMCMIRELDSEFNKTDQMKFFVCWMENSAST